MYTKYETTRKVLGNYWVDTLLEYYPREIFVQLLHSSSTREFVMSNYSGSTRVDEIVKYFYSPRVVTQLIDPK